MPRPRPNQIRSGGLWTALLGIATILSVLLILPSATAVGTCFEDPTQAACKDANTYYPENQVNTDLDSLCKEQPFASACSIRKNCMSGRVSGQYCDAWSLLHSACSPKWGETLNSANCKNFDALCAPEKSVVSQCSAIDGVPHLVSTKAAKDGVQSLCSEMPDMSQCAKCTQADCPDPLATLSELCLSMPMGGCKDWTAMCDFHPPGFQVYCGSQSDIATCSGVMEMYFHTGMQDYVLFKGWVPCTPGRYWLSLLGIMLASAAVGLVKAFRFRLELRWSMQGDGLTEELLSDHISLPGAAERVKALDRMSYLPQTSRQLRENAARGLLSGIVLFLDYSLMLLAMTFNIGIIGAVVAGSMLGTLLFGHNARLQSQKGGNGVLDERECCASS